MDQEEGDPWRNREIVADIIRYLMQLDAKLDEIRRLLEGEDGEEKGPDA